MAFISDDDFKALDELIAVLAPTASLTNEMSASGPVVTIFYPRLNTVRTTMPQLTVQSIIDFHRSFVDQLNEAFAPDVISDEVLIATFLHPTNARDNGFFSDEPGRALKQRAVELILGASNPVSPYSLGIDFEDGQSVTDRRARLNMELGEYHTLANLYAVKTTKSRKIFGPATMLKSLVWRTSREYFSAFRPHRLPVSVCSVSLERF